MMLTCGQARLMASDLLDERLTERERGELLGHIRTCTSCPQLYRSMAAISQHLRSTVPEAAPEELRMHIRRLFREV